MGACFSTSAGVSAVDAQLAADEARVRAEAEAPLPDESSWVEAATTGGPEPRGGTELEPLFASTDVIDVAWLVEFADGKVMPERKGVVPAWQELPPEAKASITELRKTTYNYGLSIAILSYGWAAKHHPDPTGEQLRRLLPALRSMINGKNDDSTFASGTCAKWGLVWDFMSLPQRGYTTGYDAERDDRTEYQLKRFAKGLSCINVWYGHGYVTALVCDWPMPADAENQHSIDKRGWCVFERHLSSVAKCSMCYLHMSLLPSGAQDMAWWDVADVCQADFAPMISPDAFAQMMSEGMASGDLKFTNGKDATKICIPQYQEAFTRLLCTTDVLEYVQLGWRPEQGKQLAAAFAYAQRAGVTVATKRLVLNDNKLGSEGVEAIGKVIEAGALPLLRRLNIRNNNADADMRTWIRKVARAAGCNDADA